jgi:hypothetical protein
MRRFLNVKNEPTLAYAKGSPERKALLDALQELRSSPVIIPGFSVIYFHLTFERELVKFKKFLQIIKLPSALILKLQPMILNLQFILLFKPKKNGVLGLLLNVQAFF